MERATPKFMLFLVLAFSAIVAAQLGRAAWFTAFVDGRVFSVPFGVLDWAQLLLWLFELLFFFPFGLLVARLFKATHPIAWAFLFGAVCGLYRLVHSRHGFAPDASPMSYFWVYGVYLMPAFGALAGALLLQFFSASFGPKRAASGA